MLIPISNEWESTDYFGATLTFQLSVELTSSAVFDQRSHKIIIHEEKFQSELDTLRINSSGKGKQLYEKQLHDKIDQISPIVLDEIRLICYIDN